MTRYLRTAAVARALDVDPSTVTRMAQAGRIPCVRIGGRWRYPADEVERWLAFKARRPREMAAAERHQRQLANVAGKSLSAGQKVAPRVVQPLGA